MRRRRDLYSGVMSEYRFSKDPWGQAVAVGALTLIPARKYPAWLRQTIIWTPAVAATAIVAIPGGTTGLLRKLSRWQGQDPEEVEFPEISAVTRAAIAASFGAVVYGGGRLSFWTDNAAESLLRKMRVPAPRAAMAVISGATAWWSVDQENKQAAAQQKTEGAS